MHNLYKLNNVTGRLALAVFLAGLSFSVLSQNNSLTNPGFESDFSGWEQFEGRVADWMPADADENPDSGSALVNNEGITDEVFAIVLFQCIVLQGEQQIEYGGEIMVPEMQPAGTEGHIFFQPFANPDCSGFAESFQSVISSTVGVWEHVSETLLTP
ncbi:MAG: hypothetical protein ACR2QG_08395, partial [Gammaproteobacteria bacterium]